MERRKNNLRVRFLASVFCILVILLLSAPAVWADTDYNDGGLHSVYSPEHHLNINTSSSSVAGTTVNLYADITTDVFAGADSFLNIYSGCVGSYIIVHSSAVVTVYGKAFSVSNGTIDSNNKWLPDGGSGTLTVTYGDDTTCDLVFYSNVPITLVYVTGVEDVSIDIKPGSYPNSINLKSKGVVPVAVLTGGDFNATTIDPSTVKFAEASPLRWTICDVDNDGDEDILFHFKTQELALDENSTEATLTGKTTGGDDVSGTDDVRIVPPKSKNSKNNKKK
jgi:hypothetical protein